MAAQPALLVLSSDDVRSVFSYERALESQETAFRALAGGDACLPPRLALPGVGDSLAFCYAARLSADAPAVSKFGSFHPDNVAAGLPAVSAVVLVLDADTGLPVALIDGGSITEIRTAAASAVAARALAPTAQVLAVLGSGVQAAAHVRACATSHRLSEVRVFGIDPVHTDALVTSLGAELAVPVRSAARAEEALDGADLVTCCTTSATPVLESGWVADGATVISVGSFEAHRHEVPQALLERAAVVVVDDVEAALEYAGPVIAAVASGLLAREDLLTLGEVLRAGTPLPRSGTGVVFYNSVGVGVQDAAAAVAVVAAARESGSGREVRLQ